MPSVVLDGPDKIHFVNQEFVSCRAVERKSGPQGRDIIRAPPIPKFNFLKKKRKKFYKNGARDVVQPKNLERPEKQLKQILITAFVKAVFNIE